MTHERPARPSDPVVAAARCPRPGVGVVVCHLGALTQPDLAVVERLARLYLTARRQGHIIVFCHPPPALAELIELAGLGDVLRSGVQSGGQPEQGE